MSEPEAAMVHGSRGSGDPGSAGGSVGAGGSGHAARVVPWLLIAGAVALLLAVPLWALTRTALDEGAAALAEALVSAFPAVSATAWTSLGATGVAVLLGTIAAILTERTSVPGRRPLRAAMLVALLVPGYVAAMGWLAAYGPGGLLDDLFGLAAPALVGPAGVVLVLGVEAMPFVYLVVAAGLAGRAAPDLERAARASGAGAATAFRTVTLPLLAPVIGAAGAIAFVVSVTAFGVPAVLGIPAGLTTMTTRIYRDLAFSSDPASFVRAVGLAVALAVTAALVVALADRLLGHRRATRTGVSSGPVGVPPGSAGPRGAGPVAVVPGSRPRDAALGAATWTLVGLLVGLPLVALMLTALTRAAGLPPTPANWTLDNLVRVVDPRTVAALGNSLLLSGVAAAGVLALTSLTILVRRGRGAGVTAGLLVVTFALPGSTLAVGVLLGYGPLLRNTLLIILVAYLAKFWALGYRPVAAGLDAIPADLVRAARASGASPRTALRTITLPLLRPVLLAGGLLVFLFGLHEVTMSSLLYGPGTATLGVVVLNLQQLGDPNLTAALAVVLLGVMAVACVPLLAIRDVLARTGWRA